MNNFLKKVEIERNIIRDTNEYFGKPYLDGLTFQAIDKWEMTNSTCNKSYVASLKLVSQLLLSWSDRSRVPLEEAINYDLVDNEIKKMKRVFSEIDE